MPVNHHHHQNKRHTTQTTLVFREAVPAPQHRAIPLAHSTARQRQPTSLSRATLASKSLDASRAPRSSAFSRALDSTVAGLGDMLCDLKASRDARPRLSQLQEGVILDCQASNLRVGSVTSTLSTRVKFVGHAALYLFEHPVKGRIEMTMKFCDMRAVQLRDLEFRFRVVRKLEFFANEYDPARRTDHLSITFSSASDASDFRAKVLPLISHHK